MPKNPLRQWDSSPLHNDSQAWFITKWPGKIAGAPEAKMLFVLEIPRSRCLCIQLVRDSTHRWEHQVLRNLAFGISSPDALITEDSRRSTYW